MMWVRDLLGYWVSIINFGVWLSYGIRNLVENFWFLKHGKVATAGKP